MPGPDRAGSAGRGGRLRPHHTRIDDDLALTVVEHPDEVVHAMRFGRVIIENETVGAHACIPVGVFDAVDFPPVAHCAPVSFAAGLDVSLAERIKTAVQHEGSRVAKGSDLTVAVIGLGYFSQFHLAAWTGMAGFERIAVTDHARDRVAWAEASYGVDGYPDVEALLSAVDPDIVDIVAPPVAHAELIAGSSRPGRLIICQKPFCRSLEEAERVVIQAEEAGVTLVIHENFRFQPWHRTIKDFLDRDGLGRVFQAGFHCDPGTGGAGMPISTGSRRSRP